MERVLTGQRVEYTTEVDFLGVGNRWIHAVYAPTYERGQVVNGWIAVVTDITDMRQMELANAHFAAIVESSEDAIISKELDGTILTWNAGAEHVYGYPAAEAIGEKMLLMVPPDRVQEEIDILSKIGRGESISHFETTRVKKGGASIDVSLAISPIRSSDGNIIGISHIARDITERKQVEKQLQQAQRLESLGVLAGGIAHDFNNLLTGILGNISLVLEGLSTNHPARFALRNALGASERASDLTRQLLAYAGKGRFIIEPVNISGLIQEISELIQASIPKNVQLRLDLAPDLPYIEADASQLQQLIMNLVINGAEAIGEDNSGAVLVTTAVQDVDEAYLRSTMGFDIEPGRYISLEVHDTGTGMDQATISRIFDPFFTTKFMGRGLGLAAVQGIVRGHKGTLKVYSQPRQGSTFKVLLPVMEKQLVTQRPPSSAEILEGNATILVVDDEQIVRQTAKAMLERYGYTVLMAENGKEGLDLFRLLADKVALVILDMTMPVMSGEETLRNLKLIQPEVKVLLSSGYNEVEAIRRFTGKGLVGFIQKPYSALHLVKTVRRALQASTPETQA
ncbi:MAG TPA: PAS domain S-box protein, partial [Bryobacteraceae bacterium]